MDLALFGRFVALLMTVLSMGSPGWSGGDNRTDREQRLIDLCYRQSDMLLSGRWRWRGIGSASGGYIAANTEIVGARLPATGYDIHHINV